MPRVRLLLLSSTQELTIREMGTSTAFRFQSLLIRGNQRETAHLGPQG